jgi:hypothetical protein
MIDPPVFKVGVFSQHIERDVYTTVPFTTTRKELYELADRFAIYVNKQNFGWRAQTNRQQLYTTYRAVTYQHHVLDTYAIHSKDLDTRHKEARAAEEKARELLNSINPELCKQMEGHEAFYLQGARYIYIVEPLYKRLNVLHPECPKSLCVYITDRTVQGNKYDWAIAMWMYLTANEEHVLVTANHFNFNLVSVKEGKLVTALERT